MPTGSIPLLLLAPVTLRQVQALEAASTTLESLFETCEAVQVETADLAKPGLDDNSKAQPLDIFQECNWTPSSPASMTTG